MAVGITAGVGIFDFILLISNINFSAILAKNVGDLHSLRERPVLQCGSSSIDVSSILTEIRSYFRHVNAQFSFVPAHKNVGAITKHAIDPSFCCGIAFLSKM